MNAKTPYRNPFLPPGPAWLHYLLALPVVIGVVLLAAFFFAAFLALFTVAAAGLLLRIWWLRRKLRKSAKARHIVDGEYVVVREYKKRIDKD